MELSLRRILNSQVKRKRYTGRIFSRQGGKFKVSTNVGTILADYHQDYKLGDYVVVQDNIITGRAANRTNYSIATV